MLTFDELEKANAIRSAEWNVHEDGSGFCGIELAGESGEFLEAVEILTQELRKEGQHAAANIVNSYAVNIGKHLKALDVFKKVLRDDSPGSIAIQEALGAMAEEIGDLIISSDRFCKALGLSLGGCVIDKFNKTSAKHGFQTHLPLPESASATT